LSVDGDNQDGVALGEWSELGKKLLGNSVFFRVVIDRGREFGIRRDEVIRVGGLAGAPAEGRRECGAELFPGFRAHAAVAKDAEDRHCFGLRDARALRDAWLWLIFRRADGEGTDQQEAPGNASQRSGEEVVVVRPWEEHGCESKHSVPNVLRQEGSTLFVKISDYPGLRDRS
jgi:hypothetical protein